VLSLNSEIVEQLATKALVCISICRKPGQNYVFNNLVLATLELNPNNNYLVAIYPIIDNSCKEQGNPLINAA